MAGPEKPSAGSEKTEGSPESKEHVLGNSLDGLAKIAGPVQPPLPQRPSQKDLEEEERKLTSDNVVESFSEQFRVGEIQHRRNALQREGTIRISKNPSEDDRKELIIVNQAATYHEYFPAIVHDTVDLMRRYEQARAQSPVVPPELVKGEAQSKLYLKELTSALRERVAFANVLLIDNKLARNVQMREKYLVSSDLGENSRNALTNSNFDVKWRQGNALNQRMIDILSGSAKIPGVDEGFLPQRLYIDLLKFQYEESLKEERKVTKDVKLGQAVRRKDQLERQNALAKEKKANPLTPEEGQEYERLQRQIGDRNEYLEKLSERRKAIVQDILSMTNKLGTDQMNRAELSTIQNEFGNTFDFAGVSAPNPDRTPKDIREKMSEHMKVRSEFHLTRMDAYLGRIEGDVLKSGLKEWAEDISNKKGREVVRRTNEALTKIVTLIIPESFGLKDHVREQLTGPLNEALGWPPGKREWEELTPEEQQKVLDKSKSVLDAIKAFDQSKIQNMHSTISLVKSMPEASNYAGQEVKEPLPTDRITSENRDELINQYGGATVYMMLFKQMDEDWGSVEGKSGFMGEYATFLGAVNENIDVHLDVGEALFHLQNTYDDMKKYLIYAAVAAFGAGVLVTLGAMKLARPMARAGLNTLRWGTKKSFEAANATRKVVGETARKLWNLRNAKPGVGAGSAAQAGEKVAETATKGGARAAEKAAEGGARSTIGKRLVGPAMIILSAIDLRRVMMRDSRLEELKKADAIQAAIELMELQGNKKALRYGQELGYLHNRQEAMLIHENAQNVLHELEKQYPSSSKQNPPEVELLKKRCEAISAAARKQEADLEKRFPITDYLMTDPQRDIGNVGVNIRDIDQARARGMQYEEERAEAHRKKMPLQLSDLKSKKRVDADLLKPKPSSGKPLMTPEEFEKWLKEADKKRSKDLTVFRDLQLAHEELLEDAGTFFDKQP